MMAECLPAPERRCWLLGRVSLLAQSREEGGPVPVAGLGAPHIPRILRIAV